MSGSNFDGLEEFGRPEVVLWFGGKETEKRSQKCSYEPDGGCRYPGLVSCGGGVHVSSYMLDSG